MLCSTNPFLHWRFEWERDHWDGRIEQQHTAVHRAITGLAVLAIAFLAFEGWHVLTYLKPPCT